MHHAASDRLDVEIDGVRRRFTVATAGDVVAVHGPLGTTELVEVPRLPAGRREEVAGGCVAPMTGVVRAVHVAKGDRVTKGQVLLVLEAMKMEHELCAHADGVVRRGAGGGRADGRSRRRARRGDGRRILKEESDGRESRVIQRPLRDARSCRLDHPAAPATRNALSGADDRGARRRAWRARWTIRPCASSS